MFERKSAMIRKVFKLLEEDESDILKGLFDLSVSRKSIRGRIKMHSELTWSPLTDVIETDDMLIVIVDISGMSGSDIEVLTDGKTLKIKGVRKEVSPIGNKQFHKLEIPVGPFERIITFPFPVDYENITANYENGMLKISIKKIDSKDLTKRIKID